MDADTGESSAVARPPSAEDRRRRRAAAKSEVTQLDAAVQKALDAQAAAANAKKESEGEARDLARAALREADGNVRDAKLLLRNAWARQTAKKLAAEGAAQMEGFRGARRVAAAKFDQSRLSAARLARDERRQEIEYMAAEVEQDTRRAFDALEADRRMLRTLEVRADDPKFFERTQLSAADVGGVPLQAPWDQRAGRIPQLASMSGPQPNLVDSLTIKKVAKFTQGDRAVLDRCGGAVSVRIVAVQLAHADVPPFPTGAEPEAVYLVRSDHCSKMHCKELRTPRVRRQSSAVHSHSAGVQRPLQYNVLHGCNDL